MMTGLPWVMPSPNMPTLDSAIVYPGTVLFEGTNISEGAARHARSNWSGLHGWSRSRFPGALNQRGRCPAWSSTTDGPWLSFRLNRRQTTGSADIKAYIILRLKAGVLPGRGRRKSILWLPLRRKDDSPSGGRTSSLRRKSVPRGTSPDTLEGFAWPDSGASYPEKVPARRKISGKYVQSRLTITELVMRVERFSPRLCDAPPEAIVLTSRRKDDSPSGGRTSSLQAEKRSTWNITGSSEGS